MLLPAKTDPSSKKNNIKKSLPQKKKPISYHSHRLTNFKQTKTKKLKKNKKPYKKY